jgi:hypothetical protein
MKQLIQTILVMMFVGVIAFQTTNLSNCVRPIQPQKIQEEKLRWAAIEIGLGDPGEKILTATRIASKQTGLQQSFILALMYSESSFNPKAISCKNYKGLMQIPQAIYYVDANVLIGANIFIEKLKITGGDYRKAIIIYKGWKIDHPEGKRQADKVLSLTRKLKEKI